MKNTLNIIFILFALSACQSETDKCVDGLLKEKNGWTEGTARLACLKVQNSKPD